MDKPNPWFLAVIAYYLLALAFVLRYGAALMGS